MKDECEITLKKNMDTITNRIMNTNTNVMMLVTMMTNAVEARRYKKVIVMHARDEGNGHENYCALHMQRQMNARRL